MRYNNNNNLMHCTVRLFVLVYACLFCAVTSFVCTTVFVVAVAVFLPGLCISKFLLFSDIGDGPLRPKSILAF